MDTRNKIIKCGIELFKREGYEKTTIPRICEAANISKGTFYYHFEAKSDIIYEYVSDATDSVNDIMPEILGTKNAYEQLWMIFEHTITSVYEFGPKLLKSYYQADMENGLKQLAVTHDKNYSYSFLKYDKLIISIIKRGQSDGEINNRVSAEDLFTAYTAAIAGIGLDWACHDGNYNKIAMEKRSSRLFFLYKRH